MPTYRAPLLTAIVPEATALNRRLRLPRLAAPVPFWANANVALAVVGVRAHRLEMLATIPGISSVSGIVMAGLGGALSPELRVGDVVIDSSALPHPILLAGARLGTVYTSDSVIATPAEKRKLLRATSCSAVDMETAPARRFADQRGAAFLAVRAISDAADEALDPAMLHLIDANGKPRIGKAIGMVCRRPATLSAMLKLRRASSRALINLATVVQSLMASEWPTGGATSCSPT